MKNEETTTENIQTQTPSPHEADHAAPITTSGIVLKTGKEKAIAEDVLDLYSFTNYREYLNAFYISKRAKNPNYSMSTFVRKAGLGENSRGYLKLVIEGKRNLTSTTVRRFIDALALKGKEALYFENLVFFNQAKNAKDKNYYFGRLEAAADGKNSEQFELLRAHYQYHTSWYYVAVRELVGLSNFNEDATWITAALRNKINRRQAQEAISVLLQLGMIRRSETGKLMQSEPLVKYTGGTFSEIHHQFHLEMIERAKESLISDSYEERNGSGLTLSCDYSKLPEIKREIDIFRDKVNLLFGVGSQNPDTVFQINIQLFQLTPLKKTVYKE